MFTKEAVKSLHTWAHQSLDVLFAHAATLGGEDFVRPLAGFGQASVRDQLVHIVFVEEAWIKALQGIRYQPWRPDDFRSLATIVPAKDSVRRATAAYLERLGESELNAPVQPGEQWAGPPRSPAFIIQHIVTHSFHHKGQVVAMCRILGHSAPDTDLQRS
jgi:uncharacterized damage-inducible protein DinB